MNEGKVFAISSDDWAEDYPESCGLGWKSIECGTPRVFEDGIKAVETRV